MSAPAAKPKRGASVELELAGLDARGFLWGEIEGERVRLRTGVPGSRVRVQLLRRRKKVWEARFEALIEPGEGRVEPRCAHFGTCGGCRYQDWNYAEQLDVLGAWLASTLAPLDVHAVGGKLALGPLEGCADPWHYRNKMDFTFGNRRWIEAAEPEGVEDDFALGLHVPGRFDKVLDVHACDIAFREAGPIVQTARALAREHGLSAWDVRAHEGLLRHLVLRRSWATGEVLAFLVTTEERPGRIDPFARALVAAQPAIATLVQGVNPGVALVAVGETERVLTGRGRIEEELCGVRFSISPTSFFQTNTPQARRLVETVRELACPEPSDALLDLYCGAGTFALTLARDVGRVLGAESVVAAVEDARRNATANGIENVDFLCGDLHAKDDPAWEAVRAFAPSLCVLDPPRAGMHPGALAAVCALAPARIVYISCKPTSAVHDLALLGAGGYRIRAARPLDLFPHTPHVECVFALERVS